MPQLFLWPDLKNQKEKKERNRTSNTSVYIVSQFPDNF